MKARPAGPHVRELDNVTMEHYRGDVIYLAYRREATTRDGKPVPFVATRRGYDENLERDDSFEVAFGDTTGKNTTFLLFGVAAAGGSADGKGTPLDANRNFAWNCPWRRAIRKDQTHWTAEMAIPVQPLVDGGIDPDRVGAYGNSAGGTLALTAAITTQRHGLEGDGPYQEFSSALQAVVCSGAVGDMLHPNHSKRAATVYQHLAGGRNRDSPDSEIRAVMRRASPSSYVRKEVPPIMLVHGAKDTVVFIDSTDEFFHRMKSAGADITYLRFEDAGHAVMGQKAPKRPPPCTRSSKNIFEGGEND